MCCFLSDKPNIDESLTPCCSHARGHFLHVYTLCYSNCFSFFRLQGCWRQSQLSQQVPCRLTEFVVEPQGSICYLIFLRGSQIWSCSVLHRWALMVLSLHRSRCSSCMKLNCSATRTSPASSLQVKPNHIYWYTVLYYIWESCICLLMKQYIFREMNVASRTVNVFIKCQL